MKRIGEVAEILGVCIDRLKRLEAAGLFTPQRDVANQRRYTSHDVERLRAILYPESGASAPSVGAANEGATVLAAAPAA